MSDLPVWQQLNPELEQLAAGHSVPASELLLDNVNHPALTVTDGRAQWSAVPDVLNVPELRQTFPEQHIEHFHLIGSTNDYLMALGAGADLKVAVAEGQLAGRGRRHKAWVSPYTRSLSISLGRHTSRPLAELGGLSTVVGMVLCKLVRAMGVTDAGLKWPNDLLVSGHKLCGILVELNRTDQGVVVVVGVGVNVSLTTAEIAEVTQPVTDLVSHGVGLDRTRLAIEVITAIDLGLRQFQQQGFASFVDDFNALHLYHEQICNIHIGDRVEQGRAVGIGDDGALLLDINGSVQAFHGGEVSLRLASND